MNNPPIRKRMSQIALNGLVIYVLVMFLLQKNLIQALMVRWAFGSLFLYFLSVYVRYLRDYVVPQKPRNAYDYWMITIGPVILLAYAVGILGYFVGIPLS
ncbi:hypothetical protein ABB02_00005 [Clostridiaceae bacterium JG1575]|nr:hypothetical protein ABB02_00005 [Clostridiaceae bacterium JG1575]